MGNSATLSDQTLTTASAGGGGNGNPDIIDAYGTTWHELEIGAGGFLTGIDIASDGTKVIRTDTYGAYLWTGTQWQQLVNSTSMPSGDVAVDNNAGVYEIQIAPSNTSRLYMMYLGSVFRTDNKGTTWTQTAFAPGTPDPSAEANDNYRTYGEKMAVDPANSNVVYVGTELTGVWMTSDAGASWTQVSAIPDGTSTVGMEGMVFDPSSGTTGGKTNAIYIGSSGNGVYRSTNAGAAWTHLTGGPTSVINAEVASSTYFAVDGTNAWKYSSGAWTEIQAGGGWWGVAVDPNNSNHVVLQNGGGQIDISNDGGSTWSGIDGSILFSATDIPWLANASGIGSTFMAVSNVAFDPSVSGKLWASAGAAVWNTTLPGGFTSSSPITWNSQSLGIEQLVANEIISPPSGHALAISWDRPVFYINSPDIFPSSWGPNEQHAVIGGWSADYASKNPSFIAGIFNSQGTEELAYSSDGGQTWTPFPTYPPSNATLTYNGIGGSIAAASSTDIVWLPADGFQPSYTLDGGNTWSYVNLPGGSWGGFNYYLDTRLVTADRVNIGTFYMFNPDNGVYKSTNGGVTWAQVYSGAITANDEYNAELEAVPNEAGNLFFTGGPQSPGPHPVNELFMRSTNGGAAWSAVANVKEVRTFGFGAPATAGGYPSIYIVGWVSNVYGIWSSTDNASTWTQVGLWPLNSIDDIKTISGDMNTYGRVYVGFNGSGYAYGDTSDAAPSVVFTAPTAGAAVIGSSVTLTAASSGGTVGISNVQFKVDGGNIGAAITSSPYTTTWNSTGVSDGTHTLSTVSESGAGTYATSSITVSVANTPPTTHRQSLVSVLKLLESLESF